MLTLFDLDRKKCIKIAPTHLFTKLGVGFFLTTIFMKYYEEKMKKKNSKKGRQYFFYGVKPTPFPHFVVGLIMLYQYISFNSP